MNRRIRLALLAALTALTLASFSPAETSAGAEEKPSLEAAREAFIEGRELMEAAQWEEARTRFEFAIGARNTPGLRYYIGYCLEQQGQLNEALASYRKAEALLQSSAAPDVEEILPQAVERVMKDMPHLHLHDVPPGARIEVDGAKRPLSAQFPLDPGTHTIVVTKKGYTTFTQRFTLKRGMRGRIYVKMAPLDQSSSDGLDSEQGELGRRSSAQKAVIWTGVGLGAIGLGVGIAGTVVFASASSELDDLNDELSGTDSSCGEPDTPFEVLCGDLESQGKKKNLGGNLMVGGYVGAGVGALGAVAAHFLWPEAPVQVQVGRAGQTSWLSVSGSF